MDLSRSADAQGSFVLIHAFWYDLALSVDVTLMRIALGVEYDGSPFCGWQTQPSGCGVQDALEGALAQIADQRIETQCAGRTDAGVHALGQVVHFDTAGAASAHRLGARRERAAAANHRRHLGARGR